MDFSFLANLLRPIIGGENKIEEFTLELFRNITAFPDLVVFGDESTKLAAGIQGKIKEAIDSAAVEAAKAQEYIYDGDYSEMRERRLRNSRYYQELAERDGQMETVSSAAIATASNKPSC